MLVTGTFTADSTSQDFTVEAFYDDGATKVSKGAQLNALLVHTTAVPEPSSTALLGPGGLALILRRRK
ncbi:MAG: PEP-CTERM sorting domain-containing protein [Akkermansiaceae bacterium]